MNLEDHPTVRQWRTRQESLGVTLAGRTLPADWLRQLALDCGADDAGVVEIGRPALDSQRDEILRNYPWTRTLLSFVVRLMREPIRGPTRSVANLEFHHTGDQVDEIGRRAVRQLEEAGIRAVSPAMGFPMEMDHFPDYGVWVVSHKPIAVAAGLGHMGIHRNVIHPRFGSFILLGTVLIDAEATAADVPLEYNPCLECKLCVAACPVGAIAPDGAFNFSACFTHNYREFMGGFTDWIEQVADSKNAMDYRGRISESETASMWQSLSHGANYKSAYCMAVCPAGAEVIGPYLDDRKRHIQEIVQPLQDKQEPVYVIAGSDAEMYARSRWKNKTVKLAGNALRPRSIDGLLALLPFVFQPNQSRGLNAVYHFTFTGDEERRATISIRSQSVRVQEGHVGSPDLRVTADSQTWLGFVAKERNLVWALTRRKIRIQGPPRLLIAFGKCFPSADVRHPPAKVSSPRSRLRPELTHFRQNDAVTGKLKWYGTLTVSEIIDLTTKVKTFRLVHPAGDAIPFAYLPGQFLTVHAEPNGMPIRRSYTISSTPTWRDRVEITVKREDHGLVSSWLHEQLKPGDSITLLAPNGTFVFTGGEAESLLLIGAGVGVTPLMSVVRYLTDTQWSGEVQMILGFRKPSDYLFRQELEVLQSRNPSLKVTVTLSDPRGEPWQGPTGRIDQPMLAQALSGRDVQRVHVCGPPAMMAAVKAALIQLGVAREHIRTESFGTITRDPTIGSVIGEGQAGRVRFARSQVTATVQVGGTLLDAAIAHDIQIDSGCRSGTCGLCRVKLLSGRVHMATDDALTDQDKSDGYVLACQAEPEADVEVED